MAPIILLLKRLARGIYDFIEVYLGVWHRAFDLTCSAPARLAMVCCNQLNAQLKGEFVVGFLCPHRTLAGTFWLTGLRLLCHLHFQLSIVCYEEELAKDNNFGILMFQSPGSSTQQMQIRGGFADLLYAKNGSCMAQDQVWTRNMGTQNPSACGATGESRS